MTKILAASILVLTIVSHSAAEAATSPLESPTKQFFAVSVPNAAAAAEWYSRIFGLRQQSTIQAPDGSASVVVLGSDRLVVEILQHRDSRSLSALGADPAKGYLVHGIFKVGLHVVDLDLAVAYLRAAGVEFIGEVAEDRANAVRFVLLHDVAGNVIQLFGPMSASKP